MADNGCHWAANSPARAIALPSLLADLADPANSFKPPVWMMDTFHLPQEMRYNWDYPYQPIKLTVEEASWIGYDVYSLPPTQEAECEVDIAGTLERLHDAGETALSWDKVEPPLVYPRLPRRSVGR
jgi:hypothetical protein